MPSLVVVGRLRCQLQAQGFENGRSSMRGTATKLATFKRRVFPFAVSPLERPHTHRVGRGRVNGLQVDTSLNSL